jgi:hypothetical protein
VDNQWKSVETVSTRVEKNQLMYTIPLDAVKRNGKALEIEFKWSDNMQSEDPMDWYLNGDVAPGGRFNYLYKTE